MAKFSSAKKAPTKTASRAVIQSVTLEPNAVTYEGGPAYTRDSRSELFLLGVANFVGENTFYEDAGDRDARFAKLARTVAVSDVSWFAEFVKWLRADGNMRSAPLVAAAEGVYARLQELRCVVDGCTGFGDFVAKDNGERLCGAHNTRPSDAEEASHAEIIDSVLQRADEPGELLAYWEQHFGVQGEGGQRKARLPKPLKRGIAKAVGRGLYNEYSTFKYDTAGKSKRFGSIVELVHPSADTPRQGELYKFLLDRAKGREEANTYPLLEMVTARKALTEMPQERRRAFLKAEGAQELFKAAGVTWEWLSSWLGGKLDSDFWEAMIPTMGYMALLRNLRNLDQAGISREVSKAVAARLEDPEQVARSHQFPFRFFSAYRALDSVTYAPALEAALDLSTQNIPELGGRTLILVDTSGSMTTHMSERSTVQLVEAAALFGVALAKKGENVDLYGFASGIFEHKINKGASVLKEVTRFVSRVGSVGHGTNIAGAVAKAFKGHDRVVIISDMQTFGGYGANVSNQAPANVPIYAFNLGGYANAAIPSMKNRYELGGLTDKTFRQIKLLEAGASGTWPWEE